MAAQGRRTGPSLESELFTEGYRFSFFEAVRLLARIYPDRALPGGLSHPSRECVRFRERISMEFPASEIHEMIRPADPARPAAMIVAFIGLAGPMGVLPSHYTEALIEREALNDGALADFLDLFHHRLVSLFYRAWEKYHFVVPYERAALAARHTGNAPGAATQDALTTNLFDLIGMGTKHLRGRLRIPDLAMLRYAGLIAQRPHSATALSALLSDYFEIPVQVRQFMGKWLRLEHASLSYMRRPGTHNTLGFGAVAGDAVWNFQAKFRVIAGPLTLERYVELLPDGDAYAEMVEWTRFFAGLALDFDIQLVLKADAVPWCRLRDSGPDAPRLGWLGWLKTKGFMRDAADAVLSTRKLQRAD